jgi:hypothetical protein
MKGSKATRPIREFVMAKKAKVKAGDSEVSESVALVPKIKATALSKDVGPLVIRGLAEAHSAEAQAQAVLDTVEAKRYDLLSKLTMGIFKAAKADKSIDLSTSFLGKEGAQQSAYLNDQLGIALGFKEVQTINVGTPQEAKRVAWAKGVAELVLSTKEEKDTPEGKRKATIRSNFLHSLKKCAQVACSMLEDKVNGKYDEKAGTLLLSGPSIKAQFGQPSVLLNEKQTIGEGDKKVKLTEKPSFTAIAAKAGEKHGKPVHRGTNTRGNSRALANPTAAMDDIAKSFISFVNKIDKPNEKQTAILQSVRDAIDAKL